MARLAGPHGHVVAADLQPPMLARVRRKAAHCGLADRITCHLCQSDRIGLEIKADFILAWYMVHETPDRTAFFLEVRRLLKHNGQLLVVEPKGHVSRAEFTAMQKAAEAAGLLAQAPIRRRLSRGVLLVLP